MAAKEKFLAVHPMAEIWMATDNEFWVSDSVDDTDYGHGETDEAAWQNAAESLPAEGEKGENDEESLMLCPFCGGEPRWGESPDSGHFIECSKCQSSTNLTYYLMDDASRDVRERWNRRVK